MKLSRFEIVKNYLEYLLNHPFTYATTLKEKVNLSFQMSEKLRGILLHEGYIESRINKYVITPKGLELYSILSVFIRLSKDIPESIS